MTAHGRIQHASSECNGRERRAVQGYGADVDRFRALTYALSVLLQFDRAADADLLAERLGEIEKRLDAAGR